MHDTNRRTDPVITDHAVLRYLQRGDASEPHPRERLAELWRRGRPAVEPGVCGETRRVDGLVLVRRGDAVATVLSASIETTNNNTSHGVEA